jgi:type IV pilus assembly protein PilC
MPKYRYVATDPSGATLRGTVDAASAIRARNDLLGRNLMVVDVKERKSFTQIEITAKKIKQAELMIFSRQLASFLRAGIPILDSLEMLTEDASDKVLKQMLAEVQDSLRAGSTFADAVAAHADTFPSYYVGIIRSAELTGNLDVVLDQLANYIERDVEATRAVKSALLYPAVIFALSIAVVMLLVIYVLPKFNVFFDSFHAKLPLPTRILIGIGNFFGDYGPIILALLVVAVVAVYAYGRTQRGRFTRDRWLLRLPAVGAVARYAVAERFCRILGAMLRAGVPVPDSMAAATEATNNRVYVAQLSGAREATLRGEGMSRPISETALFPKPVEKMLRVGEESGTLDQQLESAADYCESERSYKLKRLTTLFEPAVIVFMGVVVGFVAVALISAMYGIYDQVKLQ